MGSRRCCCDEDCVAVEVDEFDRTTLGTDWTVDSGSWSCNGAQLTGSGEIYHNTTVDASVKFTLNSGTVKALLYRGFAPTNYDYVEIGSGSIKWYEYNGFGGHTLIKSKTGPSTGEFKICYNWDGAAVAVIGPSFYGAADLGMAYVQAGFAASSSVEIERFELWDYDDCCPACPACKKGNVPRYGGGSGVGKVMVDFGTTVSFLGDTWGPTEILTSAANDYCKFVSRTQGFTNFHAYLYKDVINNPGIDVTYAYLVDFFPTPLPPEEPYTGLVDHEATAEIPNCGNFSITLTRQDAFLASPATVTLKTL